MNDLVVRRESSCKLFDKYEYLLEHIIASQFNMDQLRIRVKEVYFEQLAMMDNDIPDLNKITNYIDEENIFTIAEFFTSCGYNEEYIDQIVARYSHDVSCILDDYVGDILKGYGMSYAGDPYYVMCNHGMHESDAQNILLKAFL